MAVVLKANWEVSKTYLYNYGTQVISWDFTARTVNGSHSAGSFSAGSDSLYASIDSLQTKTAYSDSAQNLSSYNDVCTKYRLNAGELKEACLDLSNWSTGYILLTGFKSTNGFYSAYLHVHRYKKDAYYDGINYLTKRLDCDGDECSTLDPFIIYVYQIWLQ